MKIAQVVSGQESVPPKHKNGAEFIVSWLTEEFINRGHEVTLFATGDSKTKAKLVSIFPTSLTNDKNPPLPQPFVSLWNTLLAASHGSEFDIIHSHTISTVFGMPFVGETPVVETLHSSLSTPEKNTANLRFVSEQFQKINYVSVSNNQLQEFNKFYKNNATKSRNIYNGIPVERFEFENTPKDYLLYIGYINKNKGADTAVRVARKLGMKLILAGANYFEEEFFEKEIKPYLNDKIKYIGPIDFKEKIELYKNAYATLAPISWSEPFGLTLVESQASGTPVIAFNKGAASEIIDNGKTGYVVESEEEMINKVKEVETLNRQDCREWVEKNFSVRKMVDEYEKLYKSLIKK